MSEKQLIKTFFSQLEYNISIQYIKLNRNLSKLNYEKEKLILKSLTIQFLNQVDKENIQNNMVFKSPKSQIIESMYKQQIAQLQFQLQKIHKQRQVQFQIVKSFVNLMQKEVKNDKNRSHTLQLNKLSLPSLINHYKRQKTTNQIQQNSTSRISLFSNYEGNGNDDKNLQKNKLLVKLQKIENLFKKTFQNKKIKKQDLWCFSPPKAYYKEMTTTLKIEQQNLRTCLESKSKIQDTKQIERLKERQKKMIARQQQLYKKESQINKRFTDLLRKQKAFKFKMNI